MFCLKPNPEFDATVFLTRLGDEAPIPVKFRFRHKSAKHYYEWIERAKTSSTVAFLDEVIAGWSEVAGDAGQVVPYSMHALEELIDNHGAAGNEIFNAYGDALRESRQKN